LGMPAGYAFAFMSLWLAWRGAESRCRSLRWDPAAHVLPGADSHGRPARRPAWTSWGASPPLCARPTAPPRRRPRPSASWCRARVRPARCPLAARLGPCCHSGDCVAPELLRHMHIACDRASAACHPGLPARAGAARSGVLSCSRFRPLCRRLNSCLRSLPELDCCQCSAHSRVLHKLNTHPIQGLHHTQHNTLPREPFSRTDPGADAAAPQARPRRAARSAWWPPARRRCCSARWPRAPATRATARCAPPRAASCSARRWRSAPAARVGRAARAGRPASPRRLPWPAGRRRRSWRPAPPVSGSTAASPAPAAS